MSRLPRAQRDFCGDKFQYENGAKARNAMHALKRKWRNGTEVNAYRCPQCSYWHIGHRPRRKGH
jgi:hypothetical protein